MSDLFDFKPKPKNFAVMGNPVDHSKSPTIHSFFAQQCGVDLEYGRIQVDVGGFEQAVSHFQAHDGAGLNITVPFKVEAWQLCQKTNNQLSKRAQLAQSVNTLKFERDGSIFGDNTDGFGMIHDIQHNIGCILRNQKVLIVGAGGAVRGVLGPLIECQPQSVTIANRTPSKAHELAEQFANPLILATGLEKTDPEGYDLIVNGSSASLHNALPGIDVSCIRSSTLVYDMMYASQPTLFMKWALSHGAAGVFDGLGMLVEQAAESFFIWHNKRPDSCSVIEALKKL
ncbi:MAG: shikimate dehydrogenase [Gammaproteobacteria bacterium]|nr:shikimate dehydrogenase [Gammaproteobacteria bacterium]NKB63633.1 shikimate dehydrogenase [Gammaproteobacteria bacterium]NKB65307.1 shikimate dehydrogenase [Gammaproteobacteria bacterium]